MAQPGTVTTTDGSVLHHETRGSPSHDTPPLAFLHYYGGSPSTWSPMLSHPPLASLHTVTYHARGWAPSTGPSDPSAYSIKHMSADLLAILTATNTISSPTGFILVGHSMGAKVAQYFAATEKSASQTLKGLVLVAPAPLRGVELPDEAKAQQKAAYHSAESVRFILDNVLTAGPGSMSKSVAEQCVKDSLRGNEHAKNAWPEYGMGEDYAELEEKIDVPVLVLRGDRDFEKDMVGELGVKKGWTNKEIQVCGHLIPLEKPEELGREIVGFVQRITSGELR